MRNKLLSVCIFWALIITNLRTNTDRNDIYKQWINAIEQGDTNKVRELINKIDVNSYFYGITALQVASTNGDEEIVKLLLQKPDIRVNAPDQNTGFTALIHATQNNQENIVKLLLQVPNIDINVQDKEGFTALMWASINGNENITKLLLQARNINFNAQNKVGSTALMLAIGYGHDNIVKLLLQVPGIDFNAQNYIGSTALMNAVTNKNINMVKILLDAGADSTIKNKFGKTALAYASTDFKPIVMPLLMKSSPHELNWFQAAKNGNLEMMQKIIKRIDVNIQDDTGQTALMLAADKGNINIVKFLLSDNKTDVTIKDIYGNTALIKGIFSNNEDIVKLILQASRTDVNTPNQRNVTPLILAASRGNENIVKLLLNVPGISVNTQDMYGLTALMDGVKESDTNIVRLLLAAGADYNLKNKDGYTVFNLASAKFRPILEELINETTKSPAQLFSRLSNELYWLSKV